MPLARIKYSLSEIRSTNLTFDVVRKYNIFVDKKRKSCIPERVDELNKLNLAQKTTKPQAPNPKKELKPKKQVSVKPKIEKVKKPAVKVEKPVEKPVVKPKPKKIAPKTPVQSIKVEDKSKSSLPSNVEKAVKNIFKLVSIYGKKEDLMKAIEEHVVPIADMTANKIFNTLKDEELILYSRSAPRGWRSA
jgi:DNA polymerase III gamma/tau subunit